MHLGFVRDFCNIYLHTPNIYLAYTLRIASFYLPSSYLLFFRIYQTDNFWQNCPLYILNYQLYIFSKLPIMNSEFWILNYELLIPLFKFQISSSKKASFLKIRLSKTKKGKTCVLPFPCLLHSYDTLFTFTLSYLSY